MARRGRSQDKANMGKAAPRHKAYRSLQHPFTAQAMLSADEIHNLHHKALKALAELGISFPLEEARSLFQKAGAIIIDDMVYIGAEMVEAALASAPSSMALYGADGRHHQDYNQTALLFAPAGGCPNVSDHIHGRRAGDSQSYVDALKLTDGFDVLHVQSVAPEPQDIPVNERHIFMVESQLAHSDKILSLYARGRGQLEQSFALIQTALHLSDEQFQNHIHAMTIINSNSPRIFDKPMAQAIIDFAKAGQLSVITPFCLAGAMAPISLEGALLLQHMECLAAITLSQLARKGAPVSYGGFSSNVDMKSGSPAFGTPEHMRMQIISGQLARHIGLPWRSAAGSASVLADAQGTLENMNALWGALSGQANLVLHAAGWLEGGLTFGFEKFITDLEALQIIAELCQAHKKDNLDEAYDAIANTKPGGHFFDNPHTMTRYQTAFYEPLNADLSNFGTWQKNGGFNAEERAATIWQEKLARYQQPEAGKVRQEAIACLAMSLRQKGGAAPLDG